MVSTIALVISIGFAVDYSAHMCHCFTHCLGQNRDQRAIEALVLMGNPLFHGASSTLLGVLLLGFSESFVFTVFFRMMVMVVLFGAAHGMILLPVILSWLGPISKGHEDAEEGDVTSQLEGDGGGRSPNQEMGTATAAGPADEKTLYDTARVSIPPPSLALKPTSSKLGVKGTPSCNNGSRNNPSAALNSFLSIPSHQLALNSSRGSRHKDNCSASSSPMRRTKSAAASSRSGAGDLQQHKQQFLRHGSLLSRAELLAATRDGELKQRSSSSNPVSGRTSRSQLLSSPEKYKRGRRWSCTGVSRVDDSVSYDSACSRQQNQLPLSAIHGQPVQQKHKNQQNKQHLSLLNPRTISSTSGRRSSQDIHRTGSTNGSNNSTLRSHTYQ